MAEHRFIIEDLAEFVSKLEAMGFARLEDKPCVYYSKILSGALVKIYAYPLAKLVRQLKKLNSAYRRTHDGWKTKRPLPKESREQRWNALQRFLRAHDELISCFKYQADDRLTEGNYSFNLQIASTPLEQRICLEFIKALVEALNPHSIQWRRRQPDKPVQQRNGWIRREAVLLRRRGWSAREIASEIQKYLRNATWNQRSRLQFNIANSTVCKIAGIKIPQPSHN